MRRVERVNIGRRRKKVEVNTDRRRKQERGARGKWSRVEGGEKALLV